MLYMSICSSKKKIPARAKAEDVEEWVKICMDENLKKKCKKIKCYEPMENQPHKLFLMIDTDQPDAMTLISRDLGSDWDMEVYPLHNIQEVLEEDHSIVAG